VAIIDIFTMVTTEIQRKCRQIIKEKH